MKKRKERKHRFSLSLLVWLYIFLIVIVSVAIAVVTVNILLAFELIPEETNGLILVFVISLGAGLIFTTIGSELMLRYVNRYINQMNRLASGDFKARLSIGKFVKRNPTFMEITNSFNKMAEELENTEMLRTDFINNFSHEFKTPIVSIAGFAKLLKRGNLTEKQKEEYLDIIEEESLRLATMARNVLNMTKVENQSILTNVSIYNLSEQLRSSILLLEPKWTRRGIGFELEIEEYMIQANEELLKEVWINLIDNAIKFTEDGKNIKISVKDTSEKIYVSVTNSGKEITPGQQKRIFNKFYQADESHATEGNGIGLALVKRIVDLHRGKIVVESNEQTTSFMVELPR